MENASKALLIAGSILMFILLSTFAAYIFTKTKNHTTEIYGLMSATKVNEFNQKFIKYEDKKLKIQDVVSIINLANDCNRSGRLPIELKVEVATSGIIEGANTDLLDSNIVINELLEKNMDKPYKCTTSYGDNSNLIEKIIIENY